MKIKIEEVIIDGRKWKIDYNDDYRNGWKLTSRRVSASWAEMNLKKRSPIKSYRDEYKAWQDKRTRASQSRNALVHSLLQSLEIINTPDLILKSGETFSSLELNDSEE